jgi:hypothetical protein
MRTITSSWFGLQIIARWVSSPLNMIEGSQSVDSNPQVYKSHLDPIYLPLQRFLTKEGDVNCRVQFGPMVGEYFVSSEKTGKCQWISPQLDRDMVNETGRFKMCSLGIYDTYVAIFADGSAKWSLGDEYPGLLKILKRIQQGDLVVCFSSPSSICF